MKRTYETPQIEVIEIEVEDLLCMSGSVPGIGDEGVA